MDKQDNNACSHRVPLFTFGVISDVQYADINDGSDYTKTRRRFYRNSLQLLRNAMRSWSSVRPGFILQLGDVIDGFNKQHGDSERALESVLTELSSGEAEVHHVWGNHEFYNFNRRELMGSKLNSAPRRDGGLLAQDIYAYTFSPAPGFIFVVLDAYDVSVLGREESSEQHRTALDLIKRYNSNQDLNCPPMCLDHTRYRMFNGGFSKTQLDWLDDLLSAADEKQERVTIVIIIWGRSHPRAPKGCRPHVPRLELRRAPDGTAAPPQCGLLLGRTRP
ncbi:manganese-dependent ADP-ribose/CDP-alcohol diphosphatase isoform X2 [Thalassophryne amazonica]|uniref:manganese-dependent ADP-ribose/CDP-alcohol diphosphatase isoform X2 n=1 Tax=Thalassophryne amazonica TaxID=390379 RepID=UPI00147111B6|nr:manganese-dependent ADP-ribose/CDP-alcohol diphosphatase isoform X2 [Thalassophryne amazonica]